MTSIQPEHFADQAYEALKAAFSDLISANTIQSFYAFGLFIDDSLQFLHPVANTEEALTATVQRYRETVDPKVWVYIDAGWDAVVIRRLGVLSISRWRPFRRDQPSSRIELRQDGS